jgi:hypothetical protein
LNRLRDNIQHDIIEYERACFPETRKLFRIEIGDTEKVAIK